MITEIENIPDNMVGFRASGEVTKEDFKLVFDKVAQLVDRQGDLNYLMFLDTPPSKFSIGAWMKDAWLGLEKISEWNRCAIVSDHDHVAKFTTIFGKIMPGEFRGFHSDELQHAIEWTSQKTI